MSRWVIPSGPLNKKSTQSECFFYAQNRHLRAFSNNCLSNTTTRNHVKRVPIRVPIIIPEIGTLDKPTFFYNYLSFSIVETDQSDRYFWRRHKLLPSRSFSHANLPHGVLSILPTSIPSAFSCSISPSMSSVSQIRP